MPKRQELGFICTHTGHKRWIIDDSQEPKRVHKTNRQIVHCAEGYGKVSGAIAAWIWINYFTHFCYGIFVLNLSEHYLFKKYCL